MPRPQKRRRVCSVPRSTRFEPKNSLGRTATEMSVDEYETIRLIDYAGLTQEECAKQMGVARTTVQAIYSGARKKLAICIVDSVPLVIGGGNYHVCEQRVRSCGTGCCLRFCKSTGEKLNKEEPDDE